MSKKRLKTLLLLGILGLNYLMNNTRLDVQWTELSQMNYSISFLNQKIHLGVYSSPQNEKAQYPKHQSLTKKVILWSLNQLEASIKQMD